MTEIKIQVVAAVITDNGRYLVCKRPMHKRHGNMWEFPGGKLELGETLEKAAARELEEELSLTTVSFGKVLFTSQDANSPFQINFLEVECSGIPVLHEHSEFKWMRLTELDSLLFAPVDRLFIKHLESQG